MEWIALGERETMVCKIEEARARLLDTLLEVDWVELREVPQAKAVLTRKVGVWQNELERCDLDARRAKRRCSLAQTLLEQRGHVDLQALERSLDAEFSECERKLRAQEEACRAVLSRQVSGALRGRGDDDELQELHRMLTERLHPFLNPQAPPYGTGGLPKARLAFKVWDVALMRQVDEATRDVASLAPDWYRSLSADELNAELVLLEAEESLVRKRLEVARGRTPYAMRDLVEDDGWVSRKVGDLKAQIAQRRELAALYRSYYLEFVGKAA